MNADEQYPVFSSIKFSKTSKRQMLQCFTELFWSLAIWNRLDTDPLNFGNSRSNLWFALQSDSDLGPDWEGQMTHVSMIGKHDYKEK